ncbi:nucleoside permease [Iodidimonas gelatinilytica]|uniref:Nucleoside permease n=1 Tax=Iodidimonas gelatinilytica TaxID=1236966 RepID=A0A5A7MZ32_9PROT|nr:NupC/NupG family nucleoside CNT transporter [Iodidimonas gelatinilytica]GEQ96625.1 nucleoside permease [Iodidimonas gelatinilytica]GER00056.1 nucleoside permease [Iodidimonas gelatinilytica]
MGNFISLLGIMAILALAVALSTNWRAIRPRVVLSAFGLQAAIAAFVLYVPAGKAMIQALSGGVQAILNFSNVGIDMVFGWLAHGDGALSFAINVLPIIIFFSSLMAVLYHLHIMQWVVKIVGGILRRIIGTQNIESLNAAANMFVGQTEAPLVIRPYLGRLTDAQLFTVMVSGLASVAGTVLAAYAQMGIRLDYLLAASFMAAPGGLLMAKLLMPDEESADATKDLEPTKADGDKPHANVILAAAVGAQDGVKLAVNVGAMLLAFVAMIALFNGIVGGIGGWFGYGDLTLELILGYLFAPVMYLLSIPWSEAQIAGALFGEKLILNEFVAYLHLGQVVDSISPRTEAVVTFSLCGFANVSSIAILLGGLGSLIPEKRDLIARYGLRAVAAGSLSNLMSAAMASLLLPF